MSKRSCGNCKHRAWESWSGIDLCMWYEMASCMSEEREYAEGCERYEEGTPYCFEEDEYCPSATAGDYGPSNPWDGPGGRISDYVDGVRLF